MNPISNHAIQTKTKNLNLIRQMTNKKINHFKSHAFFFLFFYTIILLSCKKENPTSETISTSSGFFIVNEGNYTWGNSSLSFYNETNQRIENNIFYKANQVPLGDVAFDMKIINSKGFITVNNSGLIYVINPENAKYIATISSFISPRYILPINDSLAYVSDLYSPYISIINTKKYQKTAQIFIGKSTESMVLWQNKVFACNWSFGNKIFVVDIHQHQCIDSIQVGLQPNSIQLDKNGNIWVLCDGGYNGNPIGHEKASLWKINPQTHEAVKKISMPSLDYPANSLSINSNADSLYFIWKDIFKVSIYDTVLPSEPFIRADNANFYSLTIHTKLPRLIVCDAKNYVANGEVRIYYLNGTLLDSKETGIIPRTICFKP
ncbi:MAG: YncE family protein [Bacteroidales bacterium]|nr:YncE family protein [Bacteroidales bacterium]